MLVVLLISLAILVWFIDTELDGKRTDDPAPLHGCCPDCQQDVESGWLLCPGCRCILRACCADCGRVHDRWVRFCPWCGQPHHHPGRKELHAQTE